MHVNLLSNGIGAEQAHALVRIMASHPCLRTLCGFRGDARAINLCGQGLGVGCAVLVANEVRTMASLTSLNLSNNGYGFKGREPGEAIGQAVAVDAALRELDLSDDDHFREHERCDDAFVEGVCPGIRANRGALRSVRVASRRFGRRSAESAFAEVGEGGGAEGASLM